MKLGIGILVLGSNAIAMRVPDAARPEDSVREDAKVRGLDR
jgi:hypothetical protein